MLTISPIECIVHPETKWSLEIHMSLFVANVGNFNATAIMAGGVVARATEGDGG